MSVLCKSKKDIIIDYGGNFLATYPGKLKKKIVIGSHLDSQKHGGNFDGLTGVIMGLVLIKFFFENNIRPKYSISVMGIRGEESCWFPYSYIGSKIAVGKFDKKLLDSLKRSSVFDAQIKSFLCSPFILCDHQDTVTFPHSRTISG